jgi:ribosomal protein S16
MELLQIITFSVKIFALVTAIIVLSSYLIYKMKDKKRNKPYVGAVPLQFASEHSVPEIQYNTEPYEDLQTANVPIENIHYYSPVNENQIDENFKYQDEQYENQMSDGYQISQHRSLGQRFKILNEENNSTHQKTNVMEKFQSPVSSPQRLNTSRQAQVFNIYDYYSNNNYEPMHKIKL